MLPERIFSSEAELRAHYKAVRARLYNLPSVAPPAPAPVPEEPAKADPPPTAAKIIGRVAVEHGMTIMDILGSSQSLKAIAARHTAMLEVYRVFPNQTITWLGKQFNRDHTTIHNVLQKHGLKPPRVSNSGSRYQQKPKLSEEQQQRACELYRQGLTCREIADIHFPFVSNYCVHRALVRHGVPRRPAKMRPTSDRLLVPLAVGDCAGDRVPTLPGAFSLLSRVASRLQAVGARLRLLVERLRKGQPRQKRITLRDNRGRFAGSTKA